MVGVLPLQLARGRPTGTACGSSPASGSRERAPRARHTRLDQRGVARGVRRARRVLVWTLRKRPRAGLRRDGRSASRCSCCSCYEQGLLAAVRAVAAALVRARAAEPPAVRGVRGRRRRRVRDPVLVVRAARRSAAGDPAFGWFQVAARRVRDRRAGPRASILVGLRGRVGRPRPADARLADAPTRAADPRPRGVGEDARQRRPPRRRRPSAATPRRRERPTAAPPRRPPLLPAGVPRCSVGLFVVALVAVALLPNAALLRRAPTARSRARRRAGVAGAPVTARAGTTCSRRGSGSTRCGSCGSPTGGYAHGDGSAAFFPLYPLAIRGVSSAARRPPARGGASSSRTRRSSARSCMLYVADAHRSSSERTRAGRRSCTSRCSRPRSSSSRPTASRCSCCWCLGVLGCARRDRWGRRGGGAPRRAHAQRRARPGAAARASRRSSSGGERGAGWFRGWPRRARAGARRRSPTSAYWQARSRRLARPGAPAGELGARSSPTVDALSGHGRRVPLRSGSTPAATTCSTG